MPTSKRYRALRPTTVHVRGRGMVVFNKDAIDALPEDIGGRLVASGRLEETGEVVETMPTSRREKTLAEREGRRARKVPAKDGDEPAPSRRRAAPATDAPTD